MKEVRLYNVIQGSHTTEKSVGAAEKSRQITFKVKPDANKIEIRLAVEKIFNVVVDAVRVVNVKGKTRKFRNSEGRKSDWKKALVTLKEGHDINFAEFK